ncbi:hypothetical protein [Burkholderia pseudomallei]|uniref:hypothetical protein n=1 Tax=Burkholderia pseudomallei TaxID=28450 RepID=UPI0009765F94|nr:hypothetical protein [Burkholderia pseudomallei]OMQ86016.1 hypothetical protein AQ716_09380 [Burkholderia pseudomallei]
MQYNPYDEEYAAIANRLSMVQAEAAELNEQLRWHSAFNETAATHDLIQATTLRAQLQNELANAIADQRQRISSLDELTREIEGGLAPWRWLSGEYRRKQKLLDGQRNAIRRLERHADEIRQKNAAAAEQLAAREAELKRYRDFDKSAVEASLAALTTQLTRLASELARVRLQKEDFDRQFAAPIAALHEANNKKRALVRDIDRAKSLDQRLSERHTTAAERARIHGECRSAFQVSVPRKVVEAKHNELTSLNREIRKLENRLRSAAKLASVKIKGVVIDGSNLCFQRGNEFIGLSALAVLTQSLSRKYAVTIVFDGTMRPYLTNSRGEMALRVPNNVSVFVLASELKADETVLDTATDTRVFVISNDAFGDFGDKPAVREGRVLNHEIQNGRISVHALNVELSYEAASEPEMHSPL